MKYVWPVITVILLGALIGVTAFFLGKQAANVPTNSNITTPVSPSKSNTFPTQPTPTQTQTKTNTYNAGGILVFKAYSLQAPDSWTETKNVAQNSSTMTLTKQGYTITISQAAGGGGGCTYPGQPQQEMAQSFTSFVEINNKNGFVFRRGPSPETSTSWTVCQKNATDGSFGFPTSFGYITITTPSQTTDAIMNEIDTILASLKTG